MFQNFMQSSLPVSFTMKRDENEENVAPGIVVKHQEKAEGVPITFNDQVETIEEMMPVTIDEPMSDTFDDLMAETIDLLRGTFDDQVPETLEEMMP